MTEITFDNSKKEACAFGLTQWDKGQKLKILWEDMPESFQVHFSSRGSSEALVTSAVAQSGEAVVDIPDVLLQKSADIFVWLYLSENANEGESIKRGVLYVRPRAKPHTAVEDLEKSQQEILESILGDINENIQNMKDNGIDAQYVPDYVKNAAEAVVKKVLQCSNENSVVFIAGADAHLKAGDYSSEAAIRHMSQAMKIIAQSCPVDFTAFLGDMTSGGDDKAITDALTEIMRVNAALSEAACGNAVFRCTGSEDSLSKAYHRNGGFIDSVMLYNLVGKWNSDALCPESDKVRGYCYRDFEKQKLRVICLNTSDTHPDKLTASSETARMSIAQLQWLCESLDLSHKSDSESWRIILLGHHPLDMTGKFPVALQVLEAYVKGESLDIMTVSGESLAYDFTGKNSAAILGQFHGHLHNYRVSRITEKNIPLVAVPNAGFYGNNFYADSSYTNAENTAYAEAKTYNKTIGTAEDTAFCVIVADIVTGQINAIHYGAGKDRTINADAEDENENGSGDNTEDPDINQGGNTPGQDGEEPYTNLVSFSMNESGAVYNGTGYMDDNRLTTTNAISYKSGFVHTGYIPVKSGDIVRVSGSDFDTATVNYILVFNSNHELIWLANLNGEKDEKSGIAYTVTGVFVFSPHSVQTGTLDDMAYFRISTIGQGNGLVVTVNEDIDGSEIYDDVGSPSVTYTNIVQYATDKYGNRYSQNGYKNNYRLLSTGGGNTATGYVATGYLEADADAVIRVKGISFDGAAGSNILLYDSDLNLIKVIQLSGVSDTVNGISYEGNILKFVAADTSYSLSNLAYFRLSGIGFGENLVVTYCEEIG